MDSPTSHRRRFLELLGLTALSAVILYFTGRAFAVEEEAPADSLAVTSSRNSKLGRWGHHAHILYVPLQSFRVPPPEGVILSTSWKFLHSHQVALSQADLVTVARGGAVRVKDTSGTHSFSIELTTPLA